MGGPEKAHVRIYMYVYVRGKEILCPRHTRAVVHVAEIPWGMTVGAYGAMLS